MKINLVSVSFLLVLIFSVTVKSSAQISLPNPSFEQWDSSNNPPPFDWHQPSDWSSTNPVTEFISAGITKSIAPHSGDFAAQIRTLNIFGTDRAGGLVCGRATTETNPNYTIHPVTGGEPVSGKPKKVRGYYKFSSPTSGDSSFVFVINKKWNISNSTYDTIGFAKLTLPPTNSYTLFETDINDWNNLVDPDSIVVAFFSSNPDTALSGGVLIVDDVELDFTTGIRNIQSSQKDISVFENPVIDFIHINFKNNNFKSGTVQLVNYTGVTVYQAAFINQNSLTVPSEKFAVGIYLLRIQWNDGTVSVAKILKQ